MFRPLDDRPGTVSTCPECNQPFGSADSSHAPLILDCKHLCCEDCIRTALSTERLIVCKDCNTTSVIKTSPDAKSGKYNNLRGSFPLSDKMVEEVNKLTQMKPVDESCIGFKSSKRRSAEKQSANTSFHDDACGECKSLIAIVKCNDCRGTLFCETCWRQVHSFKSTQNHSFETISSQSFNPLENKPEYEKLLKETRERLMKKQEKLERSIKIINNPDLINEAKSSGIDLKQVGEELKQFFMYCQNTIKCLENKVMQEYDSIALSLDHSQTKCYRELDRTRIAIVELVRDMYELSKNDVYDSSTVETLLAKSQELLEKPHTVLTIRPVSGSKKITMPTSEWIDTLKAQLDFDFGKGGEFRLVKGSSDSDEVDGCESETRPTPAPLMPVSVPCPNNVDEAFENASHASLSSSERAAYRPNERRPSRTSSVQLPPNSNSEYFNGDHRRAGSICEMERRNLAPYTPPPIRGSYQPANQISGPNLSCFEMGPQPSRSCYDPKTTAMRSNMGRQKRFKEGWRGPVVISCIVTPSYFYVQLEHGLVTLEKYRKFFTTAENYPPVDREDIKIGNMYLAQCSDGDWYRVRFNQIILQEQSVLVFQIDTGKTEMVDVSKLRRIDDVMRSASMDPELAIQCCIFDCYPMGPLSWRNEDNEAFIETLKDKRNITMIVKKVQPNKLEVDLTWTDDKGCETSIRDFLLMSKLACMASRKDIPVLNNDNMKYFKDTELELKKPVDVRVTYVFGPDELYVKKENPINERKIKDMNEKIDAFYKNNQNYKHYQIINPVVGLPVAAHFTADNTWYRAEILRLIPQSKKAEVRYVDFGNKEYLPFSKIRQLSKDFIRFSIQTVKCSLTGIKPAGGTKYKSLATNFMIQNVEDKVLKMVVQERKGEDLSVILYRCDEDEDVCLNLLLVEAGLAKQVDDVLGTVASYPKKGGIRNSKPKTATTDVEKPVEVVPANPPKETPEVPSNDVESNVDESNIDESESKISSIEEVTPEDNSENITKDDTKYEIKMVDFISPNRFYVTLTMQVNLIHQVNNDMCRFYRDERDNKELLLESVEKNTKCVAYSERHKKWNRAKVLEVNKENDEALVFYTDFGYEETVKVKDLRKLVQKFNKLCDGVVICHMAKIEERSNWPNGLCELLKTSLNEYSSIHISKEPKKPGMSTIPAVLWGKTISCQGAFDPATEEWTNVNELLKKALQNDDLSEFDSVHLKSEKESLDNIDEISPTESVKKWLHSNVEEATEKGIEFSEILAKGEIPPERLYSAKSPTKSPSTSIKSPNKSTPTKADDVKDEEIPLPSQDWKQPEPIVAEEFDAMPTYVNDDFCIYVQNLVKHKKMMEMICNGLQHKFDGTTPLPMDLNWYPGQICIAWFSLDKKWYRGRVLQVRNKEKLPYKEAFVEYVDYGNTDWVDVVNLRKEVALECYPIQCYKLPIRSDCVPMIGDGKWPTKVLDFVHANTLEKKCRVKLRKEKGEDFYRIEKLIFEDSGIELFDLLCQLGYAKFKEKNQSPDSNVDSKNAKDDEGDDDQKSDSSCSIAPFDSASNLDISEVLDIPGVTNVINDPFSIPQNPQGNEIVVPYCEIPIAELNIVTVEVIEILQLDEIVVHIVDCDNETMDSNRKKFLEMNAELQKKGAEQPLLGSPSLGRMCCTKFDDDVWYRTKIIDCSDDEVVTILYVDYGNSSTVSTFALHEMKRSWFNVPIQSIRCKLVDYEIPTGVEEMVKLMNNKFEAVLEGSYDPHIYKIKLFFK